ncbi:hypothetical protein SAMN06265795_11659 [Noviherbaspirillum humi]|uniref:Uncharacterized protein n=1 Tax=Noviherbaspirillum humi TaxID=1688639 RepID=A0A239KL47_9BURK|nr:hypothetical protein [Noviherbaspirillum humi]SNT18720.1 hypothetical protein SAMN06265795_11659 [Noviherbaspirillum humi]
MTTTSNAKRSTGLSVSGLVDVLASTLAMKHAVSVGHSVSREQLDKVRAIADAI